MRFKQEGIAHDNRQCQGEAINHISLTVGIIAVVDTPFPHVMCPSLEEPRLLYRFLSSFSLVITRTSMGQCLKQIIFMPFYSICFFILTGLSLSYIYFFSFFLLSFLLDVTRTSANHCLKQVMFMSFPSANFLTFWEVSFIYIVSYAINMKAGFLHASIRPCYYKRTFSEYLRKISVLINPCKRFYFSPFFSLEQY